MSELFQLKENEQRYRALFENNPDLVLFQDGAGVVIDANSAYLEVLQKRKDEVVNRPLTEFLPPHLRELFSQKLREAMAGHKVQFDAEVQFVGTATALMLSVTKVPLRVNGAVTGVHVVCRNVTEVYASHRMIREQAHKLNTVFESITDAFFLLDRTWHFTYVNSEVARLLAVKRECLVGKSMRHVFPEEAEGVFHGHFLNALSTNQAVHFQAYFRRARLWFEVKAFPSPEGLSVYFSDVTEKVRSQEEMYRQNKDLQQFTYIVSHNLRAPLANALGLVDLLGTLPRDAADFEAVLANLGASTRQLDTVLRDMNTILSIRDKQDVAAPEPVLLADVVQQAHQNLEDALAQCGGRAALHIPPGLHVLGNRAYFYSIFFNLLSNSIKYRAEERPLRVDVTAVAVPGGGVRVAFGDNGSGFDLEKAGDDVFRLYKRFHTAQSGRGMGLYLVKTHVETMGGRIEVESAVNLGTTFTLHLP